MDMRTLQREDWKLLEPLQHPKGGRGFKAAGFVLGDPFETFLRNISEDYLKAAWARVATILRHHQIVANDLSWGCMHSGVTVLPNTTYTSNSDIITPTDFTGWTSCELYKMWRTGECDRLDAKLKDGTPSIRCTGTYRLHKWSIAPEDYRLALKLIEVNCTNEVSDWHPTFVLQNIDEPTELWRHIGKAIQNNNQTKINALVEEASRSYTSLGFRVLLRGYKHYLETCEHRLNIILPELP